MAQVTIREGTHVVPDNYLDESKTTQNNGTSIRLQLGIQTQKNSNLLLKFPTDDIPAGATLGTCILQFYVESESSNPYSCHVYRCTKSDWSETASTWQSYKFLAPWIAPGGDYVTADGVPFDLPTSADQFQVGHSNLKTLIQDAIDNRADELHIILKKTATGSADGRVRFRSGEYSVAAERPSLIVDYTLGTQHAGSATLAGAGLMTGAGTMPPSTGSATLTGAGGMSASGRLVASGSATLTAVGSISASGQRWRTASVVMSGAGSMAAAAQRSLVGAATLAGTGLMAGAGTIPNTGSATLAGVGLMAATATLIASASATLSGAGSMVAAGERSRAATATLAGAGLMAAAGTIPSGGSATLTGVGAMAATAALVASGSAVMSGTGSMAAVGQRRRAASATISGIGSMVAAGSVPSTGSATLTGVGSMVVTAAMIASGSASASGVGAMTAIGARLTYGSASIVAIGGMIATEASPDVEDYDSALHRRIERPYPVAALEAVGVGMLVLPPVPKTDTALGPVGGMQQGGGGQWA